MLPTAGTTVGYYAENGHEQQAKAEKAHDEPVQFFVTDRDGCACVQFM